MCTEVPGPMYTSISPVFIQTVVFRLMRPGEEPVVCDLINRSFNRFVGFECSPTGIETFRTYAHPSALERRSREDHFTLVATIGEQPIGAIEIRTNEHISQLFVEVDYHGQGIARELFRQALEHIRAERPDVERLTVFSSRYAVPVYLRLGFHITGPEEITNGLRYIPMELLLTPY